MNSIKLESISRRFGKKTALKNLTVELFPAKLQILLGENGAGKSTLASILTGQQIPDSGEIVINGKPQKFNSPSAATKQGIAIVHQRPLLAKNLSVTQNICLGTEKTKGLAFLGLINSNACKEKVLSLKKQYDINISLQVDDLASNLRADSIFFASFLAAMYRKPSFLILDEPCTSLDANQRKALYLCLQKIVKTGVGVLVITHSYDEAMKYAQRILLLQKGSLLFEGSPKEFQIAKIFPGIEMKNLKCKPTPHNQEVLLSIDDVTVRPPSATALFNITFDVFSSQITLIQGQREAGMETLENLVTGMGCYNAKGSVLLANETINLEKNNLTSKMLRKYGTGIVPFDRNFRGSNPTLTVAQVAAIYETPFYEKSVAKKIIEQANIEIDLHELAANLSGGMLQRLILARELFYNPKLLILSEPFQGLDRISVQNLCGKIIDLTRKGVGILVLSSVPTELEKVATKRFFLQSGILKPFQSRIGIHHEK